MNQGPGLGGTPLPAPPALATPQQGVGFPIIAIGGSAGSFEALTEFFQNLTADSEAAYVVVTHLDPNHESKMQQMVGRLTAMPVIAVEGPTPVQRNHVYVMSPNARLVLNGSLLDSEARGKGPGHMYVIDRFFQSMARGQANLCAAVVLSGTLSDGTLGLRDVRAAGGITFAQEPETARFPDMPRNAIAGGNVDFVEPVAKIATQMPALAARMQAGLSLTQATTETDVETQLEEIFRVLQQRLGSDYRHYRRTTLMRRIRRRMAAHRINDLAEYASVLRQEPPEAPLLAEEVLIHVTSFFREAAAFQVIRERILPTLLRERTANQPLRIWVPGCATGEEAYSLAIAITEILGQTGATARVQIFATDASEKTIQAARAGLYSDSITQDVSKELLGRYFQRTHGGYLVDKQIRAMCVFAVHNLGSDPPFANMDLISCCNVLVYMEPALQQRVLARFHYSLRKGGHLMVGSAETVARTPDLFETIDATGQIHRRRELAAPGLLQFEAGDVFRVRPHPPVGGAQAWGEAELRREVDKVLLAEHGPSGIVANADFEILEFRGDAGRYINHPQGAASLNALKLAHESLATNLRGALLEAKAQGLRASRTNISFRDGDQTVRVDIDVVPINGPGLNETYYLVQFVDNDTQRRPRNRNSGGPRNGGWFFGRRQARELEGRISEMEGEIKSTREHLAYIIEDHESALEELRSSNEEAVSSNEELQSTNEELETTRDELKSTNQELRTVNEELQERNVDIQNASNDLQNTLNSVRIAVVMLTPDLRIRKFTPTAQQLLHLGPSDMGRPFLEIKPSVDLPKFKELVEGVIKTGEETATNFESKKAGAFEVRIHPYRTLDGRIEGVVLVITPSHEARHRVRRVPRATA